MKLCAPIVVTGIANSAPIPTDSRQSNQNYGISCVISATATYNVQYTLDDVYAPGYNPSTGVWTNITTFTAVATTQQSSITQFATAFRLNVTASTGTVTIQVWQSDSTVGA